MFFCYRILRKALFYRCVDESLSNNCPNGNDEQSKKRGVREVSEVQTGADKKK